MTDDELLGTLRDFYRFWGGDYPEPPEPNYHNRATRREYERKRRRFWRDVRRDGGFAVRALRGER